ncbi:hypothetical protein Slin15195_G096220 [Septoria linicola]|uniref:Uncharacterized protein n=1 Tax=Septoria linicola TaxID=215465 RepID=A0A9Q9AZW8_9PEZI|nr:hypothetical protein Slin14017_G059310 [Septoria linicola]USW56303.1 hypothetical protein Slin15195_G096220 [Septoria linicola]
MYNTTGINVGIYERFMDSRHSWHVEGSLSSLWATARLLLSHPQGSQPDAAYHFIKDIVADRIDFWQTEDTPVDQPVSWFIKLAAQSLHRKAKPGDAREILTIGLEKLPLWFATQPTQRIPTHNPDAVQGLLFESRFPSSVTDRQLNLKS